MGIDDETTRSRLGRPQTQSPRYSVRPLDGDTWDAFAELVERNGGVFGGCWCMGHHQAPDGRSYHQIRGIDKRATKEALVRSGRAHAALVLDEDGLAQGWAKYGRFEELPILAQHRRAYEKEPVRPPDWRIACLYTDKSRRREGIARAALGGALDLIQAAGGGTVEAIPEVTSGRVAHGRFLFQASVELFEDHGFERVRQLGKWAWLVRRTVLP
ncbi:GNAT family N-acetyltransferase [Desertihabitans brevis]|uniref:GNAT family N-acetyltransferase n=1 Tax=Desertihabitans brevis TaxID=2268447 RepID=A0A367YY59_9ACTN|nr:GNAT family N-acetyltransferase [Desertihabitans brevis]RCK70794.1 GNAT family N-acetyltransferase [Desertihabitans brevis]